MPELIEVEVYRRLAERALHRSISAIATPDDWYLKRGTTPEALRAALVGHELTGTRRIGKLLLAEVDDGDHVLGLRFGMTGRLVVDEQDPLGRLEYTSGRDEPSWDRFTIRFTDGGSLRMQDPRRLGGVELDPDESPLGIDAPAITLAELRGALHGSSAPLKARLLDQSRVAGIGNLLVDEILWRAGLDPAREARSLTPAEVRRLHRHIRSTVAELTERGGSHLGDLQRARVRGSTCPRDGAPLERRTIGGRTTYSCPRHQR